MMDRSCAPRLAGSQNRTAAPTRRDDYGTHSLHSIALACLVGVLVMLQAYPLTGMVVH
jgi:hypothetical protein